MIIAGEYSFNKGKAYLAKHHSKLVKEVSEVIRQVDRSASMKKISKEKIEEAIANGEGVNLWRQHLLVLPDGRVGLFYNSGPYGKEQLYAKWTRG